MLKGFYLTLMIGIGPVVPDFAVPQPVIDALTGVQVTTTAGQRSAFQLTFGLSKRSLLNTTLLPTGYFDPTNRVILIATISGTPNVLVDGVVTQQSVTPSNEPGQSTLTITGEDLSRMMDLIETPGFPYPAMPNEARVAIILAKYAVLGIIPVVLPSPLIDVPIPTDEIPTHRGTDLQYIMSLAEEVGYVFYIEAGPSPGMNVAYWGPEIKIGAPQPALSVNMDAQTNVESLSFSFDGFGKSLFIVSIQEENSGVQIPIPIPDFNPLSPLLGVKQPVPLHLKKVDGVAKYSPVRALLIGLAKAAKSADVITGSGTLDVLRYGTILKARQLVGVRGAGLTYDGIYYVQSVTHNIKRGEYKQNFRLTRNAFIPFSEEVPV